MPKGGEPRSRDFDAGTYQTAYREWRAANAAREVRIDVEEEDGYTRTLSSVDALVAISPDDYDRIDSLQIDVGDSYALSARFSFGDIHGRGLKVEICGESGTWTTGLREEIKKVLTPKQRLRPPLLSTVERTMLACACLLPLVMLAAAAYGRFVLNVPKENAVALISGSYLIALAVCGLILLALTRLPNVEFLRQGQAPAWQRRRSKVIAGTSAVLLGVISSLLVIPFT